MELLHRVVDLFATPLSASHYLGLVNPLWSTHRLQARVEQVQDETADARTLVLKPGRGFRGFRAGQHLRVGAVVGGRQMTRIYSISSAPEMLREEGRLTITVKTFEGARVSRFLVREARPGTLLSIGHPEGEFCLPEGSPVRPLFITAGSGITPVMSMLRSFALRRQMLDVVHVHYAPRPDDVIFGKELARIAATEPRYRLHVIYTRSRGSHFHAETLEALCPDWRTRETWACGPQRLLDMLESHFGREGCRLHVEQFRAPLPAEAQGRAGTVRFLRSGVEVRTDGKKALLHLAEDAGIDAPHGCRMGLCHTCDATLISGCARDLRTGQDIREPGARVQVCVSAAAGNLELDL